MKGKNKLLLIAFILGVLYLCYSIYYWGGAANSVAGESSATQAGAGLAMMLVTPHLVLSGIAVVFNGLAFFMNKSGFALVAGILYAVAIVLFFSYFMFVVIQMILCFVAYTQMKKAEEGA